MYGIFFIGIVCDSKNLQTNVKQLKSVCIWKFQNHPQVDLIEGLKELSKVVILMVNAVAGYRQIKISN